MSTSVLISLLAFAAVASGGPADLLKAYPGEVLRNEIVEFKPKPDHHFSLEAPQKCQGSAPLEATARVIKCQFTNAGAASAVLNICDDKKTFCKPVNVSLLVQEKAAREPVRLVQNQFLNKDVKRSLVPGFVFASPEEARREALNKGQPVLIMISTDWCPLCNEAKEYLLTSSLFQELTRNWYKIYVDGDSLGAADWDKVVPFSYYPSFILLNARMEEIARFNGELRQSVFKTWAEENLSLMKDPISVLRERVLARRETRFKQKIQDWWNSVRGPAKRYDKLRLLRYALDRDERGVVRSILASQEELDAADVKPQILRFRISELEQVEDRNVTAIAGLQKELLAATLAADDWAEALSSLCDTDLRACKFEAVNLPRRIEFLERRSNLTPAERASMMGEEFYYLAQAFEKLKDKSKQKEYAQKCVGAYQALKAQSGLKLPRSAQQGLVPCLEQAERYQEAQELLKTLVQTYPYEPTFMIRLARLYRKQKKLDLALEWINKAETVAYGYNWFSLVLIKTDILLDLKKKDEARAVVQAALTELRLDQDRESRNQTIVARLRAAQAKISN